MDKMVGEKRDIEVTHLVKHHYPDAKLLVDGNDGYDLEGILRFVEGVDDSGYLLEAGVLALPALYWIRDGVELRQSFTGADSTSV